MSRRARSVQVSQTVWDWLTQLVETGQYASTDDAASDLLSITKRQHQGSTPPVLPSTPPAPSTVPQPTEPKAPSKNKFVAALGG